MSPIQVIAFLGVLVVAAGAIGAVLTYLGSITLVITVTTLIVAGAVVAVSYLAIDRVPTLDTPYW